MLFLTLSVSYPMLVGVPKGTQITKPSDLSLAGVLPSRCAIIIIECVEFPQIETIRQLRRWGKIEEACRNVGKTVVYQDVLPDEFNVVTSLKDLYPKVMTVDAMNECPCKVDHYEDGLLIVHIADSEPEVFDEIMGKIHESLALVFVAQNGNLFDQA